MDIGPDRELRVDIGFVAPGRNIFYFKYDKKIILTDLILEVTLGSDGSPAKAYQIERVYDVQHIDVFRDQRGRIEYWRALADERIIGF